MLYVGYLHHWRISFKLSTQNRIENVETGPYNESVFKCLTVRQFSLKRNTNCIKKSKWCNLVVRMHYLNSFRIIERYVNCML